MPPEPSSPQQIPSQAIARLAQVLPDDPYIRLRLPASTVDEVLVEEPHLGPAAAAWTSRRPNGERWGIACGGPPATLARLLADLHDRQPLDGVTVPDEAFASLAAHLTSPRPGHWSLWELREGAHPDPGSACLLEPGDERIRELLAHSPSAHVFPGDRPATWAGVQQAGTLLSVAAQYREANGLAHLVSICTHPSARGRGLAGAAIGLLVQQARAQGCTGVMLEMYAANEAGRRAYRRAGFVELAQYRSGLLDAQRIMQPFERR